MMTKSMLQNLAVLGSALLVCLVAGELFFRQWPRFLSEEAALRLHWRELSEDVRNQGWTDPNRHFGFLYRPNLTGQVSSQELEFTFTTDEKGFRNGSPWPKEADIVVVGDSMAFGYGVDDEEAWVRLVDDELPATRVINLGLIGSGPEQYLRVLEGFGLELAPELVLFMLFPGNDLADAEDFRQWLDAGTDVPYREWRVARGRTPALGRVRRLVEGSYLVAFLRGARDSLISPVPASTIALEEGSLRLTPTIYASSMKKAQPGHPVFELIMATVEEARAISKQHGSDFMVLLMPAKEEVYLPLVDQPGPSPVDAFKSPLQERGIPFIDLTPHFQAEAATAAPLFFEVDGHPNEDGYRLIARVVTEHLRMRGGVYGLWE
jgi:lysophospholipase L1-like esterase